ncbi:hypothetical protein V2A60_002407 [Cordyceps javanica]
MPWAMPKQAHQRQCRRLTDKSHNASEEPSPQLRISTDLDYDQCGAVIAAWVDAMSPLLLMSEPLAREETVDRPKHARRRWQSTREGHTLREAANVSADLGRTILAVHQAIADGCYLHCVTLGASAPATYLMLHARCEVMDMNAASECLGRTFADLTTMKVAIIGGGPSGLVTLKYLCEAQQSLGCEPVEAVLFEYQRDVGGTFLTRAYEEAEVGRTVDEGLTSGRSADNGIQLVSSKQLTCFSDFRHQSSKDFLSAPEYVDYLLVSVSRGGRHSHVIEYRTDEGSLRWDCDAVAVCSGLHVEPNLPDISGIRNAPAVMHSSQFKSRQQFDGCRLVMVVGSGETGADVAYLAATHPEVDRVVLCHNDGFHFAPKRNPGPVLLPILGRVPNPAEPGIPIDVSRANLFDTAYVHRILRRKDGLLWEYYRLYIAALLWLSSGTTAGMDQWAGEISSARHHPSKIFFNKSMKVCPYISLPYRPQVPGRRLWRYALRSALVQTPVADTHGRCVDLAPWPLRIQPSGFVDFVDNGRPEYGRMKERRVRPDMVVLCTGYKQKFPFFERQSDRPYATPETADVRRIWQRDDPSVGFIGFVRPSLGAIPPLSEMQAQLWVAHLLARHRIPRPLRPEDEWHYRLRSVPGARLECGVDHESYAYQLALDMNSAPGLTDVVGFRSLKLLAVWALGANFNTKFRLRGPWQWDGAPAVLTSQEFWATITRRPIIFGHFAVSFLPMLLFGPINLLCFLFGLLFPV